MRPALLHRLNWLLLLALVSLPQLCFWQESSDPFQPVELLLIKVLAPLALLPWLAGARLDWRALLKAWPARLLLAWVAWLWVSAWLSPYRDDGLKTALEYSLYASLFFLPAACDAPRRRALLSAFFAASVLAGAYAFFQHFGADPWRWSTDFAGRPLGTIGNPNFFGGHMVLAWGMGLAWLLGAPPGRRRGPALVFGLLTVVQWFSRSVGPWLGMAGAAAVAALVLASPGGAWLRRRWDLGRVGRALLLGLLAGGLLLLTPPGRHLRERLRAEKSVSVVNRLMMWKVAVQGWRGAPLTGTGLASFRGDYPKRQAAILRAEPKAGWNYVVTWLPHENFLYLLSETGLIGLGLFVGLWALASLAGWRRLGGGDPVLLAALLGSSGMLGVSLLNTFSNIPPTALGFFLLLGLQAWPAPAGESGGGAPVRRVPTETLAAALVLALALGTRAGIELSANRLTREGGRYAKRGDHNGAALLYGRAAGFGIADFTPQSLVGVNFELGEALRNAGRLDEALAAYREDLKENPWAPEVHNMLGAAAGQWGAQRRDATLLKESVEHLRIAADLNPGYTAPLLNLGGSYMLLGDYSAAAKAWEELLGYEPDNQQARAYLQSLPKR